MAFVHGKNSVFTVADSAATVRNLSAAIDSCSLSQDVDTSETTAFGDSAKTYIVGLRDGSFSVSGHFDAAANQVDQVLSGLLGHETAVAFAYSPDGTGLDKVTFSGNCYLTSYEVDSSVSDQVTFSGEFQVTGGVVRTVGT